jgi:putative transcriptional regulator
METVMAKRKIFDELIEGVDAMKKHREGKLTLRSYKEEVTPLPAVDSKFIRETRKRMRCSRAVFARKLRINERTLENGNRGEPSRILRRQHWFCWCAGIPIRWSGWKR